jgi:hypothetical protein
MPNRRVTLMRISRQVGADEEVARNFAQDIVAALDPGVSTTRYSRTWRLSQPQLTENNDVLWGKIGFVRQRDESAVRYDEDQHDFVTIPGTLGHGSFCYYALDLRTRHLLFEERRPDIRRNSFAGRSAESCPRPKSVRHSNSTSFLTVNNSTRGWPELIA